MGNIGLPNNFLAGDLAKATEVNANFASIINWSTDGLGGTVKAGIQNDNLGIMTGFIRWDMLTNEQAIKITSTSDVGTISIVQSAALTLGGQAGILLKHSGAEVQADASALHVWLDNASSVIPAVKITHGGTGKALVVNDGTSDTASIDESGNAVFEGDGTFGGDIDVNGAGPHAIDNQLDVSGLLTCDTVNATSATGMSVFTKDLDVQGTLTAAIFAPYDLHVSHDAQVDNVLSIGTIGSATIRQNLSGALTLTTLIQLGTGNARMWAPAPSGARIDTADANGNVARTLVTSYRDTGTPAGLHIVAGRADFNGATYGSGFTSIKSDANVYITFIEPFIAIPSVVITAEYYGGGYLAQTGSVSSAGFWAIRQFGQPTSWFNFIAIGFKA